MFEIGEQMHKIIPEETMLVRLAQFEQMREFFVQMWMQNPGLAKQGGVKVQNILAPLERPHEGTPVPSGAARTKQRGISLVELIMFIVIVSVALAGILLVMNVTNKSSADPLIHKQALAIAEAMLEEVELMPFTYCDPDDPAASLSTTTSTAACAQVENLGPEAAFGAQTNTELRYGPSYFDNVNDYNGFTMASGALVDITNSAVGPTGYTVAVAVTNNGMPAAGTNAAIANTEALLIKVTVTGTDLMPVVLEGIRTRYSPNSVP